MLGQGRRFAVALLALVAAACNATAATPIPTRTATPTPAARTAAPAITTPVALRGTWAADVQGTTASSGRWILEISDTNISLQNPVGGEPFTLDPSSMTSTSMILPEDSGCPDQSVVTPGTYTLALAGDTLTIGLVSDSCGDRAGVLSAGSWTRRP